ncbi:endonuclease/exonuclease/phosphatase family protein [Pseudoxanthomonas sp. CF125]|uniref:endonuclease/exonuclease/phosphatase family protein n=1 Tax=Pseudoxanthomonas sp. CF125 TaxID=1855303 RepID=UPI000890A1E6|nr:endonuclease/exonuclease/phosphatase family protein [Pseudoxanthomonas sp. CF125]SDQ27248.1 Metal-dependent hydrolase, endonuclease/exonuclease/phosphatase family [Pseudoxanthomonas sp. CF125]
MKTLVLALLSLIAFSLPAGAADSSPAPSEKTLKVVTLNLYHDKDDWPKRRVQIAEELKRLQPDAIALQEVLQDEGLTNQAEWLATQLGYQWHFVSTDPAGQPRRYGNALLTRHPILKRSQKLLQPLDDSRSAGFLRIDLDGRPLNLYVTHLHWTDQGGAIRARQIADLMQYIAATSENIPSLVAGDFNSTADSPELAALREGFVDTYGNRHPRADAVSSSTLNPKYFVAPKRIDHVFFQRGAFAPLGAAILFSQPDAQGVWASDHFGMLVELRPAAFETKAKPALDQRLRSDHQTAFRHGR